MGAYSERRWRSRDGLTLFARDYPGASGEARLAIICLHGLTRTSKDFDELAPLLARSGRRVIVPDIRGRGLSDHDRNPNNYQPPTYARDVLGLMDALGIARAIFLGTSMGGLVIMTIAAIRPKAVVGAILNDVGPEIAPEGTARILSYAGKQQAIRDWDDAVDYVRQTSSVAFPNYHDEDWHRFAKRTFRVGEHGPEFDYDPAISVALRAPTKWTTRLAWLLFRRLARRRPTLLVRGALSDIVSSDLAARMKRRAPALEVAEVPNVGHAPMLGEPEAVEALTQFLDKLP
jgi:pimeloyl-ACP methyl ester carboxylesterase